MDNCNIDAELDYDEPMARHTTFRIGGPADVFARPRSPEALAALLAGAWKEGIPFQIIGGGANLLVSDAGLRGIVVSTELLRTHRFEGEAQRAGISPGDSPAGSGSTAGGGATLHAGAGLPVVELLRLALEAGLSGLEFAAGLPGSVGGAVYMNARSYDREFADVMTGVRYLEADAAGCPGKPGSPVFPASPTFVRCGIERADWSYKRTPFMPGGARSGAVIVEAAFRLVPADPERILAHMKELEADRVAKGHFDYPSAGSMFKNDRSFGRPTGKILDELGFRGRRVGDAMVSPKHANIFVNAGHASAAEMLALIEAAQDAARAAFGIELEPEVVRLGDF